MTGYSLQSQKAAFCPSQRGTIKACTNTYPLQLIGRLRGLDVVQGARETLIPSLKRWSCPYLWKMGQEQK